MWRYRTIRIMIILFSYKHQINLRKAWKNKFDPNNEHSNVDPCDYSSVDEYHEALMDD